MLQGECTMVCCLMSTSFMIVSNMDIVISACLVSSTVTVTKGSGLTSVARPVVRMEAGGMTRSVAITVVVASGSTLAVARAMARSVARAPGSISLGSHDCCKSRDSELHVLYQENDFFLFQFIRFQWLFK